MRAPKLEPGNIWSGSRTLAVFTNPTELAFRKGNLKQHYPIVWDSSKYPDVETAYQENKPHGLPNRVRFITYLIVIKLKTYPILIETIAINGGIGWLEQCSHWATSKKKTWEGNGRESLFLQCLINAYKSVQTESIQKFFSGVDVELGGMDGKE